MNILYKVGGFTAGTAIGTSFVCGMDDLIYGQLRRNVVIPVKQLFQPRQQVNLDDLLVVGQGAANFASQFKPHALGPTNVKALLMNDNDYSTPQDHYFGYINKRYRDEEHMAKERQVIENLQLETVLPSNYNIETGNFDKDKKKDVFLDENGNQIKAEDMDIFELARQRGVTPRELEELMNDTEIDLIRKQQKKQKHSKKDYDKLKKMSIGDICGLTDEEPIVRKFEEESHDLPSGMVKIERKKQVKRKKTKEQMEKELEIQKILQNPQDIDYDKAMQLYNEQRLEAKDVTTRDKRRLQRLKKKAEKESDEGKVVDSDNMQIGENKLEKLASSIKIEMPSSPVDGFESEVK